MTPAIEQTAKPTQFGELPAAAAFLLCWLYILIREGPILALQTWFLPVIAVLLAGWTLLMRLRFTSTRMGLTIGPWRRYVNLDSLVSVSYRRTGGWRTRGTIFLLDTAGHRVPIYVGRFNRGHEWGPLILAAASRCAASVDSRSRRHLMSLAAGASPGP
jgi:hypothetical protein